MSDEKLPMLLAPAGKDYLWGGERLKKEYGKAFDLTPLAETWECSVHPDGPSVIRNGVFSGKTLSEVLSLHPEFAGGKNTGDFPILVPTPTRSSRSTCCACAWCSASMPRMPGSLGRATCSMTSWWAIPSRSCAMP